MKRDEEFAEFAGAREQRMYRQAYLLCGDAQQAQDLVQGTLLRLYRAWPRVSHARYVDAYCHKTMYHLFVQGRRRLRREQDAHRLPDPARGERSSDLWVTLLAALAELPVRARAVVVLRYVEDLSIEQTAEALGCATGTVKAQSHRGLGLLRERLGNDFNVLNEL